MGVPIKDIARMLNVSHTTVSRALNNSPLVNSDTKRLILDMASQLNYVPNYSAKDLVSVAL
ncbi:MAG: LacI family transcriptional regulator [Actinomycetota bacterium]|nr:MAG: LacI family transcriptional regulator [Actinomycetota bacterium]